MNIAVPREAHPGEVRVALIPEHVAKLVNAGADVAVESGLGQTLRIADDKYAEAGASVVANHNQLIQNADVLLRIRKPLAEEVEQMKAGCIYVSLLDPFNERELVDMFVAKNISAISMEMIPRITRAQKMDVLSSQANLAGYVAVIVAAERLHKIFPMMMTPAGTIAPSRVFIIGAGVAGLLLPGTTDAEAVVAPMQAGRWDAAFAVAGNQDAGFDFARSPFGADSFDYHFRYSGVTYADVFDGFVFYKPLGEHRHHYTVPGLFDEAFLAEFPHRMAIAGRDVPSAEEMREYAAELEARVPVVYEDMEDLKATIDAWLRPDP